MDPQRLSRRAFLTRAAGTVLAGAAMTVFSGTAAGVLAGPLAGGAGAATKKRLTPLVLSSDLFASPDPQRFVFAVAKTKGQGANGPIKYSSGEDARVGFAPSGGTVTELVDATLHTEGLPDGRGIYRVEARFPTAGVWGAVLESEDTRVKFSIQVNAEPDAPAVGASAPRAQSPVPSNPLGVDPICTRQPMCPLHDVSLGDVLGQGKPVVAMFATPALCTSQYCGPVLDQLLELVPRYRDRMTFVHVDIYTSLNAARRKVAPTVLAWGLPSEPWLFAVDGTGTIRSRLDGAMAQDEIKDVLDSLARTA